MKSERRFVNLTSAVDGRNRNLNQIIKPCSKNYSKSAMLLPCCAFVLRNVHICQGSHTHTTPTTACVLSVDTDTSAAPVTTGFLVSALCRDELYRLNPPGTPDTCKVTTIHVFSSDIFVLMTECVKTRNIFCCKLFCYKSDFISTCIYI